MPIPLSKYPLRAFIGELFTVLLRADQSRCASVYLEGLLSTPGKKTLKRIAAAVATSDVAAQSLHQFINASPWDWEPVRDELTRWIAGVTPLDACVLGLAYIRKRGKESCGVHTRYVPSEARAMTCQVGVGAMLVGRECTVPVDWRLHLPPRWLENDEARVRTKIPGHIEAGNLGDLALDLVDAMDRRYWVPTLPVVGDLSASDDLTALLLGLSYRERDFVIGVPPTLRVRTEGGYEGPVNRLPPADRAPAPIVPPPAAGTGTGTGAQQPAPAVSTAVVRLSAASVAGHEYNLVSVRAGKREPARWRLSNLTDLRRLLRLAGHLDDSARTIRDLEEDFGLEDFAGRSFPGWHRHKTLISAAYAWKKLHAMAHHHAPDPS
jgi:hypothetical protein